MITVAILINGQPIYTRSARNLDRINEMGEHIYKVDDGNTVKHRRDKGAVKLAIKMLELIKEA